MMNMILVAVDGSEHAAKAVDLASDLALRYGAELLILHVRPRIDGYRVPEELEEYARLERVFVTEHDILESVGEGVVRSAAERAKCHGLESTQTLVEIGHPAQKIVEIAAKIGANMVVMGNRGFSGLGGLMGSVSQRVAHTAECTVVTVK